MDVLMQWLTQFGAAWLQLLTQPFYYVAIIVVLFILYRQMSLERQLFAVRLFDWKQTALKAIIGGFVAGIVVSIIIVFLGTTLTIEALWWLWGIAALLSLFRVRFLSYGYSAGLIIFAQWAITFAPLATRDDWIGVVARSLQGLDATSLLLLAALLQLVEAVLIRMQRSRLATPFILEGKRGKLIGGYRLQGYWPIPLFLLVPVTSIGTQAVGAPLAFDPLLIGDIGLLNISGGWSLLAFPVFIGFSDITITQWPEQKLQRLIKQAYLYGIVLLLLAGLAWWQPITLPFAAIVLLLMREIVRAWTRMREMNQSPIYTEHNQGLHVLGVVPDTPATELHIVAGETIMKVNGIAVNNQDQLYEALMINAAFCKLDIRNREGELRFVHRARYAGEHHQLGVILAPDARATFDTIGKNSWTWLSLMKRIRTTSSRLTLQSAMASKQTKEASETSETEVIEEIPVFKIDK